MTEVFRVRVAVRDYAIDANGHVGGAILLQYGQRARWECLCAAGINHAQLRAAGTGPVRIEDNIRYHRELRAGEEVGMTCRHIWGNGKTVRIEQEVRHTERVGRSLADVRKVLCPVVAEPEQFGCRGRRSPVALGSASSRRSAWSSRPPTLVISATTVGDNR